MAPKRQPQALLGVDVGRVTSRATLFGIREGKYRLIGQASSPTSLSVGQHIGEGLGEALETLQTSTGHILIEKDGGLIQPYRATDEGLDKIVLSGSAGPRLRTALLGLAEEGSLAAGRALVASLPVDLVASFGLPALTDPPLVVDRLLALAPQLLILTGGEDGGSQEPLAAWVEVARTVCQLLPMGARPAIVFAGNPDLREVVSRRLEPLTVVRIAPNIQPRTGQLDLAPAQALVERFILQDWLQSLPGWQDLTRLAGGQGTTPDLGLGRMVRFLGRSMADETSPRGVTAVDLGGGHQTLALGQSGEAAVVSTPIWDGHDDAAPQDLLPAVRHWLAEDLQEEQVAAYLHTHGTHPGLVPATAEDLAIELALTRVRLQRLVYHCGGLYPDFPGLTGEELTGHFEPLIASGAVFSSAPNPGQVVLALLDGLQPRGVTTVVLDQYHLLPLLGAIAQDLPILPIHLLETDVFQNLGTAIIPTSPAPTGELILTVQVEKEDGTSFDVEVTQGTLRRVVLQVDEPAMLNLSPAPDTDVGFGGPGVGGRLKVTGGALGVVLDARGRPLKLPAEEEARVALLQRWHWTLGG
ncbi:glutamate mutase L [bacterium]|nr:glutamate mutase L [bacterium]